MFLQMHLIQVYSYYHSRSFSCFPTNQYHRSPSHIMANIPSHDMSCHPVPAQNYDISPISSLFTCNLIFKDVHTSKLDTDEINSVAKCKLCP